MCLSLATNCNALKLVGGNGLSPTNFQIFFDGDLPKLWDKTAFVLMIGVDLCKLNCLCG